MASSSGIGIMDGDKKFIEISKMFNRNLSDYLKNNPDITQDQLIFVKSVMGSTKKNILDNISEAQSREIPLNSRLIKLLDANLFEPSTTTRNQWIGWGMPRKVGRKGGRKVGGNEELRNAIRNKLHSVEHLVQPNYLAEFTHLLNLVNNPNQNISMGLWYDTIDLIRKIMLPYRRVRRQGGNRIIGAGIFDLISPIANMFSGTSFNTPLDSIIPREISTQVASSIADEGLSGGRKMSRKNPWIAHVKSVASKKGISYTEALKIASKTYKK